MSDTESKPWWQSRTIIGALVVFLGMGLRASGVDIVNEELTAILTLLLETVGASLAIWGRMPPAKPSSAPPPAEPTTPTPKSAAPNGHDSKTHRRPAHRPFLPRRRRALLVRAGSAPLGPPTPDAKWIAPIPRDDPRPFWVRLLTSIRWDFCTATFAAEPTSNHEPNHLRHPRRPAALCLWLAFLTSNR
jgi:hypothetical protein